MDVGDKVVCHQYRLRQIHSVKPHRVSQHAFTSGNPLNPCHPERSRRTCSCSCSCSCRCSCRCCCCCSCCCSCRCRCSCPCPCPCVFSCHHPSPKDCLTCRRNPRLLTLPVSKLRPLPNRVILSEVVGPAVALAVALAVSLAVALALAVAVALALALVLAFLVVIILRQRTA